MKASGSGRTPGNFSIAARTSRDLASLAAGHIGVELEQHVGRRAKRDPVDEHLAQRAPTDRKIRRRAECLDDGVDKTRIVRRHDAEAVADRVVEARLRQVELDMPSLLL